MIKNLKNMNLSETLKEIINTKGITLEKLSELTNIPKNHLEMLINDEYENLPPAPYVRGYLFKIAKVLRLNGDELWQTYKKDLPLKTSGQNDKLASNRYAIPTRSSKKMIIFIIILIFVIVYLSFNWRNIFGAPKLEIITPASSETTTNNPSLKLTGRIDPKDKLMINNEEVVVDANGWFEKDFNLQQGLNIIEFKVKKILGKEKKIIRQINYQP